jgi:lipopolysaccharide export system permease protein
MEQTPDKRYLILTLFDGNSYDEQRDKKIREPRHALVEGQFEKMELRMDLSSLAFSADNEEVMKNPAEMMSVRQLDQAIDSLKGIVDTVQYQYAQNTLRLTKKRLNESEQVTVVRDTALFDLIDSKEQQKAILWAKENTRKSKDLLQRQTDELKARLKNMNRHKIEWHRKFFLAVVCLVLFFIGAPLGAIIRKGGIGIPTLIALGLFVVYQLLTMAGERMAKNQFIEPWLGMWISTVILLPMSIWITRKAMRESALLEKSPISLWFTKLARFFRMKTKEIKA